MNSLVVYDSNFGNTKLVAEAIGRVLGVDTPVVSVDNVRPEMLADLGLLVVGSPINGFRPTQKIGQWLSSLRPEQIQRCRVATFDTRVKLFFHGDAAKRMSKLVSSAGAIIVGEPAGFYVKGKEGPMEGGEIARAEAWAKTLIA